MNTLVGRDYAIGALVGFLTGIFAIPVLVNIGVASKPILFAIPLVVPVVFAFGVWIGGFLSRFLAFFAQLGKFAAVGFLNTAIDFGLLNFLSAVTGITAGIYLGGINVPATAIAMANSYAWNKFWVFGAGRGNVLSDLPKFIIVSIGAIVVNSGIVALGTDNAALFGFTPELWLNAVKVFATAASFLWNFIGYKLFVFRKSAPASSA